MGLGQKATDVIHQESCVNRVRMTLLGGFALSGGEGRRAIGVSSRKGRALLAYLAMQPHQSAGRDELATLLWERGDDRKARQSLRQELARLRVELGDAAGVLMSDAETIALRADAVSVDALAFLQHAQACGQTNLADAVALYSGALLERLYLSAEAFEEWLRVERQRIATAADRIFERQVDALDAAQAGDAAIALAERLLAFDTLREDRHRVLLRLYAKYHGREAARARAKALADLLRIELDVSPELETRALLAAIAQGAFDSPKAVGPSAVAATPRPPLDVSAAAGDDQVVVVPDIAPPPRTRFGLAGFGLTAALGVALAILAWHLGRPQSTAAAARQDVAQIGSPADWKSPSIAGATGDARGKSLKIVSLLVMPFVDRNPADKAGRFAGDAMTDDLINQLSFANGVRVISNRTARYYRDKAIDPSAVGRELGVRYVLEGSLTAQSDKMRANVALIDPVSRLTIWTDRIERPWGDGAALLLDDIVARLGRELHIEIAMAEGERAALHPGAPGSFTSRGYAALFKGHSQPEKLIESERLFKAALQQDPDDTDAQIGLAARNLSAAAEIKPEDRQAAFAETGRLLQKVLAKRPNNAGVHLHLGRLQRMTGQLEKSLVSFAKVIELQPSNVQAHAQIGRVLSLMGRQQEALDHFRYAIRLSPKDSALAYWTRFIGEAELELKNYREAIAAMEMAVQLAPKQSRPWGVLAAAYALAGRLKDAERCVATLRERAPGLTDAQLMRAFARANDGAPARTGLAEGLRLAFAGFDSSLSR